MRADLFWFSDEQWSKIEPHLPINQPGPQRHDDRRILSGNHARAEGGLPLERLPARIWPA
jgi:transposase